jgi:hypothetical protein
VAGWLPRIVALPSWSYPSQLLLLLLQATLPFVWPSSASARRPSGGTQGARVRLGEVARTCSPFYGESLTYLAQPGRPAVSWLMHGLGFRGLGRQPAVTAAAVLFLLQSQFFFVGLCVSFRVLTIF